MTRHLPPLVGAHTTSILAAMALLVAGPVWAQAVDPDAPIRVTVRYGDLDLARPAGARAMLHRIEAAASKACGGEPDLRVLSRRAFYDRCRKDTVQRTVLQLNAPLVTNLTTPSVKVRLAGG